MTAMSDYLEDAILNHILRNTSYTSPATVYVGLFTAAPSDAGGGTEVSGNGYARVAVTFAAPSSGACTNSAEVNFGAPTVSDWGTLSHWGIFDANTAGNLLLHGALTSSKSTAVGDDVLFAIGDISISAD